jgi:hypothetical protein
MLYTGVVLLQNTSNRLGDHIDPVEGRSDNGDEC